MSATNTLPIGTITAFGGDLANKTTLKSIQDVGWSVTAALISKLTPLELFKAIGTANVVDTVNFNVPDLRGKF